MRATVYRFIDLVILHLNTKSKQSSSKHEQTQHTCYKTLTIIQAGNTNKTKTQNIQLPQSHSCLDWCVFVTSPHQATTLDASRASKASMSKVEGHATVLMYQPPAVTLSQNHSRSASCAPGSSIVVGSCLKTGRSPKLPTSQKTP